MQLKSIINKVLPLLFAAFLLSCTKEMEQPVKYRTIHYKAQAGNEALTRATVDGGNHGPAVSGQCRQSGSIIWRSLSDCRRRYGQRLV